MFLSATTAPHKVSAKGTPLSRGRHTRSQSAETAQSIGGRHPTTQFTSPLAARDCTTNQRRLYVVLLHFGNGTFLELSVARPPPAGGSFACTVHTAAEAAKGEGTSGKLGERHKWCATDACLLGERWGWMDGCLRSGVGACMCVKFRVSCALAAALEVLCNKSLLLFVSFVATNFRWKL
jgi:hypothetical protein